MLSIGVMASGQGAYYIGLAREDYYIDGGEPPGIWHGKGAEALGLCGRVDGAELTRLFEGFHPKDDRALIEIQSHRGHRPGWDLTFSAPKSVSTLWSQADAPTRQAIQEAHLQAVQKSLDYLEDTCPVARRGRGGEHQERGGLVFATFEHGTSRAQDPQLHTHALFLNVALREDGSYGTVNAESVFKAKMAAGALYRAELAHALEERPGLAVEREDVSFGLPGVPRSLCERFSTRRAEIEAVLAQKGMDSPEAAAIAALATRSVKGHVSREDLFAQWQKVGQLFGWEQEDARMLLRVQPQRSAQERAAGLGQALGEATSAVTAQQSHFSERDFVRRLAEASPGRGLGADEVLERAGSYLRGSEEIVALGQLRGERVYTTREMLELEQGIFESVERSKEGRLPGVSEMTLRGVIASRQRFSDEQGMALQHIAQEDGGSIRIVAGMAGTGKTTLLQAARMSWELEGFSVYGAALSGRAARGLQEGAGIESRTLHRMLWDLEHGKMELDDKAVLVVDEAGMVGTRQMARLVSLVEEAGAKLVLVGDARQLQPIEAGGVFPEMAKRLGAAQLDQIVRQREEWAREAVVSFASGDAREGLRAYAQRGLLSVAEDARGAREELIARWKPGGIHTPEDQLIFTGTRLDGVALNRMAQEERRKAGVLSDESVRVGGDNFHVGDRVLFTQKSTLLGVVNGSMGEVTGLDAGKGALSVRLDDGGQARFRIEDYNHLKLGYAMTSHKGQGATVERAFVLAGGSMQDREISYVQTSRSRGDTHIFADRETAGDHLERLVRQMSESRAKETAHAVAERAQEHVRQQTQTMSF